MSHPDYTNRYEPDYKKMYLMLAAACERAILLLEETKNQCEELRIYGEITDEEAPLFPDLPYPKK